jgi:hypothetical protein
MREHGADFIDARQRGRQSTQTSNRESQVGVRIDRLLPAFTDLAPGSERDRVQRDVHGSLICDPPLGLD